MRTRGVRLLLVVVASCMGPWSGCSQVKSYLCWPCTYCTTPEQREAENACGDLKLFMVSTSERTSKFEAAVITTQIENKVQYVQLSEQARMGGIVSYYACIGLQHGKLTPEEHDRLLSSALGPSVLLDQLLPEIQDIVGTGFNGLDIELLSRCDSCGLTEIADSLRSAIHAELVDARRDSQDWTAVFAKVSAASCQNGTIAAPPLVIWRDGVLVRYADWEIGTVRDLGTRLQGELRGVHTTLDSTCAMTRTLLDRQLECTDPLGRTGEADSLTIMFGSGSFSLDDAGTTQLRDAVDSGLFRSSSVLVVGYADTVGADITNLMLSRARAEHVAMWLVQNADIPPQRVKSVGLGQTTQYGSREGQNRRVVVFVK